MFQPPKIDEFKDFFDGGEFVYGEQPPSVRDKDIERAQQEALIIFPSNLFPNEKEAITAFNFLTAHFLLTAMNLRKSGGAPEFAVSSQSADGLSVSYQMATFLKDSFLSQFTTTGFGVRYASMVYPAALANKPSLVRGGTTP